MNDTKNDVLDHLPEAERPLMQRRLREGMEATLTVNQLGVTGSLLRTLESTNPFESMIEIVRDHSRRRIFQQPARFRYPERRKPRQQGAGGSKRTGTL